MTVRRRLRVRPRLILAVAGALALLAGGWLWLRDSSLVAVHKVTISGVSGPDAAQIEAALVRSARNMTTLDVRVGQLRTAVAPYPVVRDLRVGTQFPHGLRIRVLEHLPVGALLAGGRTIAASGDGTVLRDVPTGSLPTIPVRSLPGGSQVTERDALAALALLAATPRRLLARVSQVSTDQTRGLVVQLRSGPSIDFGERSQLAAKWIAATEVLATPSAAGASYIDVTDPARPAAGVGEQAVVAAGLATTGSQAPASGSAVSSGSGAAPLQPSTSGG